MKQILTFLLLLMTTCSFGQFLETGLVWNYTFEPFQPPPFDSTRIVEVSIIGDTIIMGKEASIIEGKCGCVFYPRYLHQEEHLMYYFYEGAFHLLYDFSLGKGDTLSIPAAFSNQWSSSETDTLHFTIDSVSYSPHIGSDTLKIQHITTLPIFNDEGNIVDAVTWGDKIFEHIGSNYCLFPMAGICESNTTLRCVQISSVETINFTAGEGCLLNSIVSPQDLDLSIFPNPFVDLFQIENNAEEPYDLRIINLQGKVMQIAIEEPAIHKTINSNDWPSGIYFIEIKKGNQLTYQKIIKQ